MLGHLKTTQQNEVLGLVRSAGLDPLEFEWVEYRDSMKRVCPTLNHKPSEDYWFMFGIRDAEHTAEFAPGRWQHRERTVTGIWPSQLIEAGEWLGRLKAEIDAPDLWKELASSGSATTALASASQVNTAFEPHELAALDDRLRTIESYVVERAVLADEHEAFVHQQLTYLTQQARGQGRHDWYNMAVGVFFNIVIAIALPAETARDFITTALAKISEVVKGLPMLRPGP